MTDEARKIVAGVECCERGDCRTCPYLKSPAGCSSRVYEDAIELIRELSAKVEVLEKNLGGLLSHVTDGKFTKASYTLQEMLCFADDHCGADCETAADRDQWKQRAEQLQRDLDDCNAQRSANMFAANTERVAAAMWKQRAEAAERDILTALRDWADVCDLCVHRRPCLGEECPDHISGVGATGENGAEYPDFRWDCRDFNYGDCPMLENAPCHGCDFENHFKWRGVCAENGGGGEG